MVCFTFLDWFFVVSPDFWLPVFRSGFTVSHCGVLYVVYCTLCVLLFALSFALSIVGCFCCCQD